jgi:hypothetical protein
MLTIALICASYFVSLAFSDCTIPPIYLDIHARDVEGTNNALSYGAYINVGSPIQQLSLWPSLDINETTLADTKFCSSQSCSASSAHGLFDPTKSTSFKNNPPQNLDNTSTLTNSVSTLSESGTDILHLWSELVPNTNASATNLTSFPLQLLTNYTSPSDPFFGPAGLIGLGPSSSLLTTLFKAGKIPSLSYGLFLGSAYPRNNASSGTPLNGSLTLGGYDAARFTGPVHSFPISSNNPGASLQVPVTSITLTSPSNSTNTTTPQNLLPTPFTAHLSTSQYELTFPSSLSPLLATIQNPSSNLTLTLTLGPNLTITFSPSLLSTQPIKYSPTGPYILGTSLLSSLYLTVHHDATTPVFFLAPAVSPAPSYIAPTTLCGDKTPTPQGTANLSVFVKNGLVGLVVGVSIAALAVGVLIAGCMGWKCCFCCGGLRRKSSGRKERVVSLKKMGQEMEMGWIDGKGDGKMSGNGNEKKANGIRVLVAEKMGKGRSRVASDQDEDEEESMYFAPPPRRATVVVDKKERKMGLKGILKVKVPA